MFRTLTLLVFLFCSPALQQTDLDWLDETSLNALKNYFGCSVWEGNICIQCSERYFFNKNGVCCEVDPNCHLFNQQEGLCEQCYEGYEANDGKCKVRELSSEPSRGCKNWEDEKCIQCSKRYFWQIFSQSCQPISDQCRTWKQTGECESCYIGYLEQRGACIVNPFYLPAIEDNLCAKWVNGECRQCSFRAYRNEFGKCAQVDPQCHTWDPADGHCFSCYTGYRLQDFKCLVYEPELRDVGCQVWDWRQQLCLKCSERWVLGKEGSCLRVDDKCASFEESGACTFCYKGYFLSKGVCEEAQLEPPPDFGCRIWDWDNLLCLECSRNFIFGEDGQCMQVNPICKSHNDVGLCSECYAGYQLVDGACMEVKQKQVDQQEAQRLLDDAPRAVAAKMIEDVDFLDIVCLEPISEDFLACLEWDFDLQECICSEGVWVREQGGCITQGGVRSDDFFPELAQRIPSIVIQENIKRLPELPVIRNVDQEDSGIPSDIGCKTWDWKQKVCLECSHRFVFVKGVCSRVSDYCQDWDESGQCMECYKGYLAKYGICFKQEEPVVRDLGCKEWDWDNKKCLQCSHKWVLNEKHECQIVNSQCATWDDEGKCLSCYKGCHLEEGRCALDYPIQMNNSGCKKWDWDNLLCLQCSSRYYMRQEDNSCQKVSDLCKQYDPVNGNCTSCFLAFYLQQGRCLEDNFQEVVDEGCQIWDWKQNRCLQCSHKWVYHNQTGRCRPVDDKCSQWDQLGKCTECFPGYLVANGSCQVFNPLCKKINGQGGCTSCYQGYVLLKENCIKLSDVANLYEYYRECCPEKLHQ